MSRQPIRTPFGTVYVDVDDGLVPPGSELVIDDRSILVAPDPLAAADLQRLWGLRVVGEAHWSWECYLCRKSGSGTGSMPPQHVCAEAPG